MNGDGKNGNEIGNEIGDSETKRKALALADQSCSISMSSISNLLPRMVSPQSVQVYVVAAFC